jgi:hypothetical protein
MTRTVHTSLGSSALSGKQAIDQAAKFKHQLRAIYDKPASVALVSVVHADPPRIEVVAQHDADDPVASAWIRHAQALAPELWEKLGARRRGVVRE